VKLIKGTPNGLTGQGAPPTKRSPAARRTRTAHGMSIELRWDPMGVLQVTEMKEVVVAVHLGPSAKLACRRAGRNYSGTAVHGDIDIIPAHTTMRWEMRDQNDRCLLMTLPDSLLQTVAAESDLNAARMEIIDRWQVRDNELETLSWSIKREIDSGFPSGRVYLDGLTLAVASRLVMRHSSLARTNEQRQGGLVGQRLKQVLLHRRTAWRRFVAGENCGYRPG
jgi:AraC family transcriptional regulator